MPGSWYPSTELRMLGTPKLAALFYGILSDMSRAMGVACIVMTLGILLSGYLFAGYYAIHVVVVFFTLGVYARLISGKSVNWFWLIVTVILAFAMGMQGIRRILILSGPLLITEIIRQLSSVYSHKRMDKKDPVIIGWCILLLLAGYAGTRMPFSVGQEGISRNIRKGLMKLWEKVLPDILVCLGWTETSILGRVLLLLLLAVSVFGLSYYVKQMIMKQDLDNDAWLYLMLWCSPIITMLLAAFTTADSAERYYFMLLFALAFGFVGLLKRIDKNTLIIRVCGYIVILLLFVVQLCSVYLPIMKSEEPPRTEANEVSRYLEESGYDIAYATFEHANTMTVLSGGAVRVAAVASVERMDVCKWLSSTDWYVPNVPYESEAAYIVTESEKETFEKFLELHQGDIEFDVQIGKYFIYVSDYNFSCLE